MKIQTLDEALALLTRPEPASVLECESLRRWAAEIAAPEEFTSFMNAPELEGFKERSGERMEVAGAVIAASRLAERHVFH